MFLRSFVANVAMVFIPPFSFGGQAVSLGADGKKAGLS